ncbi:MAG: PH domain-containing protein [Minisyncoccales bacterium]|jgi:uncharacterized membrane protein YdbT with pleckstrin-like domain
MINLNTKEKMPGKIKAYYFVKLILFIFLFSLVFMPLGSKVWTSVFWLMAIFIGLPIYLILLVDYSAFNFILEEGKITLNSGVIVKRSKTIAFDKVQNVESVSGILRRMFGLSTVEVWTSSASQINVHKAESENAPDGRLTLQTPNAEWLKNYILDKQAKK